MSAGRGSRTAGSEPVSGPARGAERRGLSAGGKKPPRRAPERGLCGAAPQNEAWRSCASERGFAVLRLGVRRWGAGPRDEAGFPVRTSRRAVLSLVRRPGGAGSRSGSGGQVRSSPGRLRLRQGFASVPGGGAVVFFRRGRSCPSAGLGVAPEGSGSGQVRFCSGRESLLSRVGGDPFCPGKVVFSRKVPGPEGRPLLSRSGAPGWPGGFTRRGRRRPWCRA